VGRSKASKTPPALLHQREHQRRTALPLESLT
jgi:hypothetical protein